MAVYTIEDAKYVAKILKLANRSVRQAMYSTTGDQHIVAVRAQLDTLDGTQAVSVTVAKAIIDIVKNDLLGE